MMISYQLGVESVVSCAMNSSMILPVQVNRMSLLIIAADKALAITSPYKYRRWMKPRVVAAIITSSWLSALIPTILSIATTVNKNGYTSVPEFGTCIPAEGDSTGYVIALASPATVQSALTISLNVYLVKIAIQVRKQIEKETRLSGESEKVTTLKKKQRNIKRNMKPIITLLVVTLSNILGSLFFVALILMGRVFMEYREFLYYIIISNGLYLSHLLNPITYGLYFKQVREPMMKCLKRFNKANAVAPQLQRTAWM